MKHLAIALPLVLVAACGGSGGNAAKDAKAAKAAYIAKAEAVCSKANAETKALKTPAAASELAPYVAHLVQIADRAVSQVRALEPPAADKAELTKKVFDPLAAKLTASHVYAAKVAAAAAAHDDATLTQLTLNPPKGTAADLVWMRSYGFKECVDSADVG